MTSLTPRMKELIQEEIATIDQWIDEALSKIRAAGEANAQNPGELLDAAAGAIDEAIKRKLQRLVTKFPDINVDGESFTLPFFPIYELFVEIDALVDQLQARIAVDNAGVAVPADAATIESLIARLRELIRELEMQLVNRPWFEGDDVPEILERLREKLRRALEAAEEYRRTGTFDPAAFEGVESYKKAFLDEVSDPISLWDVYSLLKSMDAHLGIASSLIRRNRPLRGRALKLVIGHLEMAIAVKHKLATLVRGTPAREPNPDDPFDEILRPERPDPPKPEYEPGMEDLPPFPPDPDPGDPSGPHHA